MPHERMCACLCICVTPCVCCLFFLELCTSGREYALGRLFLSLFLCMNKSACGLFKLCPPMNEASRELIAQSRSLPLIGYLKRNRGIESRQVGAFDLRIFDSVRKSGRGRGGG